MVGDCSYWVDWNGMRRMSSVSFAACCDCRAETTKVTVSHRLTAPELNGVSEILATAVAM